MASQPAPRPKSKRAGARSTKAHTTQFGRNYRRVKESKKWNKG